MDLRQWFLLHDRPTAKSVGDLIGHFPCSEYRCPAVLNLFMAGFHTGFKLTDSQGQPTEALRVLVQLMQGELCPSNELPPEERRNFTDHKGIMDPVFKGRWFIRKISVRLRNDGGATGYYGWAGRMFKTDQHRGLMEKRVTETIGGEKQRPIRYVVACPPGWELSDDVYCGLWHWSYSHGKKVWPCYDDLAALTAREGRKSGRLKEVEPGDGCAKVASAQRVATA